MGSNPYILHQIFSFWLSGGAAAWLGWTVVKATWLRSDPLAAFQLRLGLRICAGLAVLATALNLWALAQGFFVEGKAGAAAWIGWLVVLAMLAVAWQRRPALMQRAMSLRDTLTPFERVRLYEAHLQAHPGDPEAIRGLLEEPAGLQVIGELDRQAVQLGGRRIGDVAVEVLQRSELGRVRSALASGYLSHRASLVKALEAALQAAREREQSAILERSAGAAQVGEQLRRLLEDAAVYPGQGVCWEVSEGGVSMLERSVRLAIKALEQGIAEHLGRVHLPLLREEGAASPPGVRWTLRLEVLSAEARGMTWQEDETVRHEVPWVLQDASRGSLRGLRSSVPIEPTTTRRVTRRSSYPVMRVRLVLMRGEQRLGEVEADSASGWASVQKGTLRKQGIGPSRVAAELMQQGLLRGLGLHIQGEGVVAGAGLILGAPGAAQAPARAGVARPVAEEDEEEEIIAVVEVPEEERQLR